jgi:hypothetical protein
MATPVCPFEGDDNPGTAGTAMVGIALTHKRHAAPATNIFRLRTSINSSLLHKRFLILYK